MLLYRGLGEEEALGYLCVAEPLGDELQYLLLAAGECVEVRGVLVRYEVLEELSGGDDLALGGHFHGAGYLIQLHPGVDETPGPITQGNAGERQIQVHTEGENGDAGVDAPDAFYTLGDALGATGVEYGANGDFGVLRGRVPDFYPPPPLQGFFQAGGQDWILAIYPDKPQMLTLAALRSHRLRSPHPRSSPPPQAMQAPHHKGPEYDLR